jgi:hypothetical protein
MKKAIIVILIIISNFKAFGQIEFGPRAGIQTFIPIYKPAVEYKDISVSPKIGYNAGIAFKYKANDLFSFYSELSYSRKGKLLTGGIKDRFKHDAVYNYLDLPVLMRMTFQQSIRGTVITWFVDGGGFVDYWLSGKGYIKSFELDESAIDEIDYKIKFKPKTSTGFDDVFTLYLTEPSRLQVGLMFDLGYIIPMYGDNSIQLILRYAFRQSWLARDHPVDVGLGEYAEDFRTMEHCLSFNAAYMFGYNFGENRKGKSTHGKIIRTDKSRSGPSPKTRNFNKVRTH